MIASASRADTPRFVHRFGLRALAVTLASDTPDLHAALAHIVNRADERLEPSQAVEFRVGQQHDGQLTLAEDEGEPRPMRDINAVLVSIHRRLSVFLFGTLRTLTALHSGAVTIDGRLVLLTGDRGAGKTTLLLKLAMGGAEFHCDEHVMASADGRVHTLPRRLHVKPGTLECLPAIAAACRAHPLLRLDGGVAFYPLDPTDIGLNWRSADAPLAAIVHLTPAFGWPVSLEPIPRIDMVKRLFVQASGDNMDFGRQAADICGIVRGVPTFALRVGNLDETADVVTTLVRGVPAAPERAFST